MKRVYKNGNYYVRIDLDDGTKERITLGDKFIADFPESIDICCTSYCTANCPYCYAQCSVNGKHADIMNAKFIDTLHPYTEAALQLNDLSHPDLIPFLEKLKSNRVIANCTINQIHFEQKEDLIADLISRGLVKGVGVSLRKATPEFVKRIKKYPNAVVHTINGVVSGDDLEIMRDNNLKILILGYKDLGRGISYKKNNDLTVELRQRYLYDVLETLPYSFKIMAMDNLAISQLKPQRFLSKEKWDEIYMGDEGTASMYVDLVTGKFGVSSLCKPEEMHPLMDNINDMFEVVKRKAKLVDPLSN